MSFLDWLRGGSRGTTDLPPDSQEERVEIVTESAEAAHAESVGDLEPTAQERRDAEAMRHHGI
jgi:hypothetical protein